MKLQAKEQIKTLLAQKGMKLKELAKLMSEKTGKNYTLDGLSHKLRRNTVMYNEMLIIAEILKYDIQFVEI